MSNYEPLTDLQWQLLESHFPTPSKRGRGKPHTPWRGVLNSILWVIVTKGKWTAIPKEEAYASKSAAHRWFAVWEKSGKLKEILDAYKSLGTICEGDLPSRRNRGPKYPSCPVMNYGINK